MTMKRMVERAMAGMERRNGTETADSSADCAIERLAIVIVTYRRQDLLSSLLASITQLTQAPWRVIVVDNENSAETEHIVTQCAADIDRKWGGTQADGRGGVNRVVYAPQSENLGGAGGFSAGVGLAYDLGAQWFWIMDDDVAVLPDAIEKLSAWTDRHEVIQGGRYDYDGGSFYWQYRFLVALGIPNPIAPSSFGSAGYRVMNTLCFEGGLVSRNVVRQIGLPDPRFFIYWDDTVYGYLASKVTNPIVIPDVILRRTREIANWDIAGLRQLNSTSDLNRYHIMRNRGYMARYFMEYGDYRPFQFAVGTAATFAKEIIRLVAVDRGNLRTGLVRLVKGWRDSRKLLHDPDWKPMPSLE